MNINILPDLSLAAAPFTTVLGNALKVAATTNSDSIIQYSAPARVEPICLVDAALAQYEHLYPILQTTNSIFAAYYMQAAASMINVSAMRLLRDIDPLKPDRNMNAAIFDFVERSGQQVYGDNKSLPSRVEGKVLEIVTESMSLPRPGAAEPHMTFMITEAADGKPVFKVASPEEVKRYKEASAKAATDLAKKEYEKNLADLKSAGNMAKSSGVGMSNAVMDTPNLAVGKIFEVSADYGQGVVTIQVIVALKTMITSSQNLQDIYATGGELRSASERWHGWRSGQLRFVEDIMFCSDIIENHRRTAIRDNTGVYLLNRERDTKNRVTALLTGKASIGTASGIAVFDSVTAKRLEAAVGGKLSDFNTREKIFKRTYAMNIIVVDREWEDVTVYNRGIPKAVEMPIAEYTRSKSKGGSDVADIVKLFLSGSAPTL
jgi:hypothetical protein